MTKIFYDIPIGFIFGTSILLFNRHSNSFHPPPIEPGGTFYARSPSPEPPVSREKDTPPPPPMWGIGYHWQLKKKKNLFRVFSGNRPETTAKNTPLSQESGNAHAAPSCIRVGGGGGGQSNN